MTAVNPVTAGPERPKVSFVIPVRNGAADLPRCLGSIAATESSCGVEVIVVDNGSTDDSGTIARRLGARVLERPGLRVGGCRNEGARAARGDIIAFVDADNEIGPAWLDACERVFDDRTVGTAGYPYRAPADATWVQQMYDALRSKPASRCDVEWLGSGNLAVRRSAFDQVGGFDESLEACEDVHLCHAVLKAGYRVISDPGMDSVHHGDPRTLADLFFGELWRGRDNLRVSLRGRLSIRSLPSLLLPVAGLAFLVLVTGGLVAWPWLGGSAAAVGAIGLMAIATLKALVIIVRGRLKSPGAWARGFIVAGTYELARALSLVSTATHRTRVRLVRHA